MRALRMTITVDPRGGIVRKTGDVLELTGHDPTQLIGSNVSVLITPEFHEAHDAGFERWSTSRQKRSMGSWLTLPLLRRDGSQCTIQMCLTEREGAVTGLFTSDPDERLDPGELLAAVEAR